jgi:hypothetical protein
LKTKAKAGQKFFSGLRYGNISKLRIKDFNSHTEIVFHGMEDAIFKGKFFYILLGPGARQKNNN